MLKITRHVEFLLAIVSRYSFLPYNSISYPFICRFRVNAEIRVFCEPNFYGTDCGVACIHGDTDDRGHYECHPDTGAKICHENYFGKDCKKKCVAQDNDSGHYFCDDDGKKICRNGVYANFEPTHGKTNNLHMRKQ